MPLYVDSVIYTEDGDPATPNDGEAWYNPSQKKYKKRRSGSTEESAMLSDIAKETVFSYGNPGIHVKGTSYITVSDVLFSGTDLGTPECLKVYARVSTSGTGYVRIYDITNAQAVVTKALTNTDFQIVDLGTLANLSSGEAMWEVQVLGSAVLYVDLSSLTVRY